MYESQTFNAILQRMLDRVPPDIDKREGSIIYDALAPEAWELSELYAQLDLDLQVGFALTSTGDFLDLKAADYGITRKAATKALRKGLFYDNSNDLIDVPIGSRFSAGGINFKVIERLELGQFKLECETAGTAGNVPVGNLMPIDYINGLAAATITDVINYGTAKEGDDVFRARLLDQIRTPPTSGNRAAYRKWALEVNGVGDAYVEPVWNGPNTIKVSLLGIDYKPASAVIVQAVKDYIDPNTGLGEGMGEGASPGGAITTAVAAPGVPIDVSATVSLDGSRTLAQVVTSFKASLDAHLMDVAKKAFALPNGDRSIKFARVGTILLDTPGVTDYENLQVNGAQVNIAVAAGSVAVLGEVTLT